MIIIVRTDISVAQQIIQASHACYEAGLFTDESHDAKNTRAVLGKAKNLEELIKLNEQIHNLGIRTIMFFEPDINEFTAICTEPMERNGASKLIDLYE